MSVEDKVKTFIRPEIQALAAYHVPDSADTIKLDAMENPYQWPSDLVDRWLEVIRDVELNRYPDPSARVLKEHLRESMEVPDESEILLGNGSDELIQMIMMAMSGKDKKVLVANINPGEIAGLKAMLYFNVEWLGLSDFRRLQD